MEFKENPFLIQGYYFFQSEESDPIRAFEKQTQLRVNRSDTYVFPMTALEKAAENPKNAEKSWWNSFWQDGWSHIAFGTVTTGLGVGAVCVAMGPVGWFSAVVGLASGSLAIGAGAASVFSGSAQLYSSDSQTKQFYAELGDVSLSLSNIPGFATGTATYFLTGDIDKTINFANYAGLMSGGASFLKNGWEAFNMQRLYNLKIGSNSTRYSSRTRNAVASLIGVNPKGLEASHLIPQRVTKQIVQKLPRLRRPIENLANGPLGINFLTPVQHAMVDPYRFKTLAVASKEALAVSDPFRTMILKNYPQLSQTLGFVQNMSPTLRPAFNSLVITGGRFVKVQGRESSDK